MEMIRSRTLRRWRAIGKLLVGRLVAAAPTMFLVATLIFFTVALLPGDLATEVLGQDATPEAIENLRRQLGLDRPILSQYLDWLNNLAHADFGHSLASGINVLDLMLPRLYNTFFLAGMAAVIAVPLALFLGILSAMWRYSILDRVLSFICFITVSMPDFFVAYVFIVVLSVYYPVFPSIANIGFDLPLSQRVWSSLLPALTLTFLIAAPMIRMTRVAIMNTLSSPYIEMAHLKGNSQIRIMVRHVLPNIVAPVTTVVMLNISYLIVGVVIIETIFVYPGLGQLLVDSVSKRDLPVVQACSLAFAATYVILNSVADAVGLFADPRRIGEA